MFQALQLTSVTSYVWQTQYLVNIYLYHFENVIDDGNRSFRLHQGRFAYTTKVVSICLH